MKRLKNWGILMLSLLLAFSMSCTALAADADGSITISNATIGETYHVYKLFDATYGVSYEKTDSEGKVVTDSDGNPIIVVPTAYTATGTQRDALEADSDNVFEFTAIVENIYTVTYEDNGTPVEKEVTDSEKAELTASGYNILSSGLTTVGTYQVTVKDTVTEDEVIAFVQSYIRAVGSLTACCFPGAEEVYGSSNDGIEDSVATKSTVVMNNLAYGYYFVTSSVGSVVSLGTTNPDVTIVDKNDSTSTWDDDGPEPTDPDDPLKDVLDSNGKSINEEEVSVTDVLTYSISYTNNSGELLSEVIVYDAQPEGTEYVSDSIGIQVYDENSTLVTLKEIPADTDDMVDGIIYYALDGSDADNLTWTLKNLPDGYTLEATFDVTVLGSALSITDKTIVNDADLDVTLGENTYKLKTNTVKNPVDDEDEPQKDVKSGSDDPANDVNSASIDGVKVTEGDILTYTITYENKEADAVNVTIKDAPPTGTVYVAGSAGSTLSDSTTVTIDADNNITWVIRDLEAGSDVTVYFQVEVTKAALSIIDQTIVNDAEVNDGKNTYTTNTVKNPTSDTPENPGDVGKVIINADGTESTVSTGAFGDTVTFDVSIDAVNLVADEGRITNDTNTYNDQVAYYYIYDQMDPGFTLTGSFTLTINNVTYDIISTGTNATSGATTYTFGAGTTAVGTMYTYVNTDADGNTINTLIGVTIYWADAEGNGLYPDCEIHLTYTATINENAVIAGSGNLNRAVYDYSVVGHDNPEEPDPEDPKYPSGSDLNHETEERTTVTYTYALGIYKISAETGEALSGAEFTFADAGGNTVYMAATGVDGVYNYCSAGTTGATDTAVSNSDGQIIIKGIDIGTYTLTEVKAPKGYVLLTDPVMLKATMSSSAATTVKSSTTVTRIFDAITESEFAAFTGIVYTKDEDGTFVETEKPAGYTSGLYQMVSSSTSTSEDGQTTVTETYAIEATSVTIENAAGISLPSTGGIGTTIFYIIGGILVFGAVVLLITRKRMKKID